VYIARTRAASRVASSSAASRPAEWSPPYSVARRLQPPQPAICPSASTTMYVPSSMSWVSRPMIDRLDRIWASSRNGFCSSPMAASISGTSTGRSSRVASRLLSMLHRRAGSGGDRTALSGAA
jgi:hypothetical protein